MWFDIKGSREMAEALERNKEFKFTEFPTGGHGIAGQVFNDPAFAIGYSINRGKRNGGRRPQWRRIRLNKYAGSLFKSILLRAVRLCVPDQENKQREKQSAVENFTSAVCRFWNSMSPSLRRPKKVRPKIKSSGATNAML